MIIQGLDTSLTRTGVAVIDSSRKTSTCYSIATKALPVLPKGHHHSIVHRRARITRILDGIGLVTDYAAPDLVVIEGPALSRANAGTFERYGLWWTIVNDLIDHGIPIAVCGPTTRAKWATGKGNAGKDEVMLAIDRLWPGVASNNDEADALALATIGAQKVGWPVPSLNRHWPSLTAVDWPDVERLDRITWDRLAQVPRELGQRRTPDEVTRKPSAAGRDALRAAEDVA